MAIESVITVAETEQVMGTKGPYLKAKTFDSDGKGWTYNIFDQATWNMWQPSVTLKIEYQISGNFRNITKAEAVTGEDLPEPSKPAPAISGEERGMWFKEMGNRIGDGSIEKDFPHSVVAIKGQYYKKMSEITGVHFKKETEP